MGSDLAKCRNTMCQAKSYCYRFRATDVAPPAVQAYGEFKPNESGKCDDFIQMRPVDGSYVNGSHANMRKPRIGAMGQIGKIKKVGKI